MSATDFLPRREAGLAAFSTNFNNMVNADPLSLGVPVEIAADYNAKHNAFITSRALATAPDTRSRSNICDKNVAQRVLRKAARRIAGMIQAHPGMTDNQKASLGLTINRPGGRSQRIARPTTAPGIQIVSQTGSLVEIRLINKAEPSRRGRPTGVKGAILRQHIGEFPPADLREWKLWKNATRTVNTIELPPDVPPGTKVWLTGSWHNPRCEESPAAEPRLIYTQFGAAPVNPQMKLAA